MFGITLLKSVTKNDPQWRFYPLLMGQPFVWTSFTCYINLHLLVFVVAFIKAWLSRHHHVAVGGTAGSPVLCELTRDFHPAFSTLCGAEDLLSGERLQVGHDRGCQSLQLPSSFPALRARRCGLSKVLSQGCLAAWPNQRRRCCSSTDYTQSLFTSCRIRRLLSMLKTVNITSFYTCTSPPRLTTLE